MEANRKACLINLAYKPDEKCVMRMAAVMDDSGRIQPEEIYGYAKERSDPSEALTLYPFLLTESDETDSGVSYQAEWGNGDMTHTVINGLGRPLQVGQEVERLDTLQGESDRAIYTITSITPWKGIES